MGQYCLRDIEDGNENGIFVHETLLTVLSTWKQQERNPYEEIKRAIRAW